jgi:hypothetical protein
VAHEQERAAGIDRDRWSREKPKRTGTSGASAVQQQILSLHGAIGNAAVVKLMRFGQWASGGGMSDKWSPAGDKWAPASDKQGPGSYSSKAGPGSLAGQTQTLPMLRMGSSGPLVAELQTDLGVPADGIFGKNTAKAVRAVQRAAGLQQDGVVGPDTWAFIRTGAARGRPELFNAKLEPGVPAAAGDKLSLGDKAAKFDPGSLAGDKFIGEGSQKL